MKNITYDKLLAAQYDVIFDVNDMGEYVLADAGDNNVKPKYFYDAKEAYKELAVWLSVRKRNRAPAEIDDEQKIIEELNEIARQVALRQMEA